MQISNMRCDYHYMGQTVLGETPPGYLCVGDTFYPSFVLKTGKSETITMADSIEFYITPVYRYEIVNSEEFLNKYKLSTNPSNFSTHINIPKNTSTTVYLTGVSLTSAAISQVNAFRSAHLINTTWEDEPQATIGWVRIVDSSGNVKYLDYLPLYKYFFKQHFSPSCTLSYLQDICGIEYVQNFYKESNMLIQNKSIPAFRFSYSLRDQARYDCFCEFTIKRPNGTVFYTQSATGGYSIEYSDTDVVIPGVSGGATSSSFFLTSDISSPDTSGVYTYTFTVSARYIGGKSYGPTYTLNGSFTVIEYRPPYATNFSVQRYKEQTDDTGQITYVPADDGTHVWISIDAYMYGLQGHNNWTITYYGYADYATNMVTIASGSTDSHIVRTQDRTIDTSNYPETSIYSFKLIIKDALETIEYVATIPKSTAYFNVEKTGVAVGQRTTGTSDNKKFEVAEDYTSYFYGGIAGLTKYQSGEIAYGKWINGKNIYRYVYSGGVSTDAGTEQVVHTLPSFIDTIVQINAYLVTDSTIFPLPYCTPSGMTYCIMFCIDHGTRQVKIKVGKDRGSSYCKFILILDYTKTTESVPASYQLSLPDTSNQLMPDINIARTDYIAMMSGIEIPEDDTVMAVTIAASPSKNFEKVKTYYSYKYWNTQMVNNAIDKWVTAEEAQEILNTKKNPPLL